MTRLVFKCFFPLFLNKISYKSKEVQARYATLPLKQVGSKDHCPKQEQGQKLG